MAEKNVVAEIVERRKKDIEKLGYTFGHSVPHTRTRPVTPFMADRGVILEVKRASPSKGNIAPDLDSAATARAYCENGAAAISCLTEENYFKGSLEDLQKVCAAVDEFALETGRPKPAVLRKDFLIDEKEIETAYLCGADAVLLISGILTLEKLTSMTSACRKLGIRALVEVRTAEDALKVLEVKKQFADTIVCGVNSRNLKDFTIDLLVPAQLKNTLGGQVIFESGITTPQAAAKIASMGFSGILLGEFAARNPEKAGEFVKAFNSTQENECGSKWLKLAQKKTDHRPLIKICGLTQTEDLLLADQLGADFTGFIFSKKYGRNVYGEKFEKLKQVLPQIHAEKVAVITDAECEEAHAAASLVKEGVLDMLQLHDISYENLPDFIKEVPHYFAVTDKTGNLNEKSEKLFSYGEPRFLQDTKNHSYNLENGRLWLAGGVTPENAQALVKQFNPELIDISGGIEDSEAEGGKTGVKNQDKMRKFFKAVRETESDHK